MINPFEARRQRQQRQAAWQQWFDQLSYREKADYYRARRAEIQEKLDGEAPLIWIAAAVTVVLGLAVLVAGPFLS